MSPCQPHPNTGPHGYAQVQVSRRKWLAHRLAWTQNVGPIPKGMHVLHECDNRKCVNIEHLFLGTHTDNMQDMATKGRHHNQRKTHCPKGHPYDEKNTRELSGNRRGCRACHG